MGKVGERFVIILDPDKAFDVDEMAAAVRGEPGRPELTRRRAPPRRCDRTFAADRPPSSRIAALMHGRRPVLRAKQEAAGRVAAGAAHPALGWTATRTTSR
jgi:hypothetical protein